MMTTRYATVGELRSTARMAEVLVDAGYDPSNDHEMQIGMTAYEAALLVCTHTSSKPPARQTQKTRAGRNDPCPCGSGKKYKKCCIDTDRPPSAANDRGPLIKFGPGVVPRLWDGDAAYYEDCDRLSEIICQDPAFTGIGYSAADIGLFLKSVNEKEPGLAEALRNSDQETWDAALDDLGDYFVREFGSLDFGRSLFKERCLEAAKRATSNAAVRALATGICLALMAEVSTDAGDPLAHLLFRQAFIKAAADVGILNRMFDQFGDRDELRRLIETDDPSVPAKIQSIADGLSAFEQGQLRKDFDRSYKNLRYTIAEEEFPVPLPFATQMALVGQFASASRNKTPSMEELSAIIETFADELTEDDYVLYGKMLDGWLKENKKRGDRVVEAMVTMRQLCAVRSIADLAPMLLLRCIENKRWVAFDEDEQNFIASPPGNDDTPAVVARYGAWLRAKGYPAIADRLVRSWEDADLSQVKLPHRERRIA